MTLEHITSWLKNIAKSVPAVTKDWFRTVTWVVAPGDEELILRRYPIMSIDSLKKYLSLFKAPRLYEVLWPIELAYRMLNGMFSNIITPAVAVATENAYNPLSILSKVNGEVLRVKTTESELLHEWMEKLNLRQYTMTKVNDFFNELFWLQIVFACSCGVWAVRTKDTYSNDFVTFLENREEMWRTFDSDVLTTSGRLFFCESADQVPQEILNGSPDVNQTEIESYIRYYTAVTSIIKANPYTMDYMLEKQNKFFG